MSLSKNQNFGMYRNMQVQVLTIKNVILYVKNGTVTLAKCKKTGRFVNLKLAKCLYSQSIFWLNLKAKNGYAKNDSKEKSFFALHASYNIVAILFLSVLYHSFI